MTLFPPDVSATGHVVDQLFYLALWLTGAAFLLVVLILGYCVVCFRERPGHRAVYTHGESRRARWLTLGFALLIFLVMDVNLAVHDHAAWKTAWEHPPDPRQALRVEIMPEQFAWNIRYAGPDGRFHTADDITTINQLHVPTQQPVVVQLSSKDVIHSFFLPYFRIKMDAVPGLVTSLYFRATTPGTYEIACAEHCGFGHYRMKGFLVVEPATTFNEWLAGQAQQGPPDATWGWDWSHHLPPEPEVRHPPQSGGSARQAERQVVGWEKPL